DHGRRKAQSSVVRLRVPQCNAGREHVQIPWRLRRRGTGGSRESKHGCAGDVHGALWRQSESASSRHAGSGEDHGTELASAVGRVLNGEMKSVRGSLRSAWEIIPLKHKPRSREELREMAKSDNALRARFARGTLENYNERIKPYPYPV